jgi:hypothetical protein
MAMWVLGHGEIFVCATNLRKPGRMGHIQGRDRGRGAWTRSEERAGQYDRLKFSTGKLGTRHDSMHHERTRYDTREVDDHAALDDANFFVRLFVVCC